MDSLGTCVLLYVGCVLWDGGKISFQFEGCCHRRLAHTRKAINDIERRINYVLHEALPPTHAIGIHNRKWN